jgi:hypothetical protein
MASRPDLPLKQGPANLLRNSGRIACRDMQAVERRLAGLAACANQARAAQSRRAEFMAVGTETSPKHSRR